MSFRVWDAGKNQNIVLFIMVLSWTLLILLGIVQSQYYNFEWSPASVVGLIFVVCILPSWISFFLRKPSKSSKTVINEGEERR